MQRLTPQPFGRPFGYAHLGLPLPRECAAALRPMCMRRRLAQQGVNQPHGAKTHRVNDLHSRSSAPHQRDVEVNREQENSRVPHKEQHLRHRAENSFFDIAHKSLQGLPVPCHEFGGHTLLPSKPLCRSLCSLRSSRRRSALPSCVSCHSIRSSAVHM